MPGARRWSDAEISHLCAKLGAGETQAEAGAAIGRSAGSVASQVARMRMDRDQRLPVGWRQSNPTLRGRQRVDPPVINPPAPVDRDPCFRCGVRRDVGCVHTAHERAA